MSEPFEFSDGPQNARVILVGEAMGENEAQAKRPFVGWSGKELWKMLGEAWPDCAPQEHRIAQACFDMKDNGWIEQRKAWLEKAGVLFTNVLALQPPNNNLELISVPKGDRGEPYPWPMVKQGKYLPRDLLAPQVERLLKEISICQPNLVICLGNTACGALLHSGGIGSIRGTVAESLALPGIKCLPTYHPAGVLRNWAWRPTVIADLIKARREMEFPEIRRPERTVVINPSILDIEAFWVMATQAQRMAIDIETEKSMIKCVGFALSRTHALVVPFIDKTKPGWSYWQDPSDEARALALVADLCDLPCQKIFQNGLYDIQYLWKYGCPVRNMTADTMLLHHSMFPELPKGLGFLGSIYTNESAWKLMRLDKSEELKRDE